MSRETHGPSRRRVLQGGAVGAGAALLSSPLARADQIQGRPNIVLVILDQMTERMISAHRSSPVQTPGLDRLASMGTSFTQAYCADPSCSPARASLLTGRPSSEHGVLLNRGYLVPGTMDIGTWMREKAGYQSWYTGKWHILGLKPHKAFEIVNRGTIFGGASDLSVLRSFEGRLSNHDGKDPFFAVVSLLNPHDIAEWVSLEWGGAEASSSDLGISDLPPLPANFQTTHREASLHQQIRRRARLRSRWGEEKWRLYLWWYHRMIEMVDGVISRLLDILENSRYGDDTLLMLTSDHGELAAEHGLIMKQSLYEASAKVPLMAAWPGVLPAGRVDRRSLVSHLDVVPTVCDLAGVETPPRMAGRSLLPLLRDPETEWRTSLQVQSAVEGRMIRTSRYKYIHYRDDEKEQLFDLQADPWELVELSQDPEHADALENHRTLQVEAETLLESTDLSRSGYDAAFKYKP